MKELQLGRRKGGSGGRRKEGGGGGSEESGGGGRRGVGRGARKYGLRKGEGWRREQAGKERRKCDL